MKKINALVFVVSIIIISACSSSSTPAPTPIKAIPSVTQPPPTATAIPTSSPTPIPPSPIITSSNVANLQEYFRIRTGSVSDAIWMPDGNVALLYPTGISIYDPASGQEVRYVEPENKAVSSDSDMSRDGKYVASLVDDTKIQIWNTNDGKVEFELETKCLEASLETHRVSFNNDSTQLAVCDEPGVSLWDLPTRTKIATFEIKTKNTLSIVFSPDNLALAATSFGIDRQISDVIVWDLETGKLIKQFRDINPAKVIRFNHQGNIFAWKNGSKIVLFDILANETVQTLDVGRSVTTFEFSPDDTTIIICSSNGTRLLDISTGKFTEINKYYEKIIKYSPDGNYIIAGLMGFHVNKSGGDAETIYFAPHLDSYFSAYNRLAFDPEGKYLAVGGDTAGVDLWDLQTKQPALQYISSSSKNFLFDPKNHGFITNAQSGDNWEGIQEWDLLTENQINFDGAIADENIFTNIPPQISPDGNLLAIGVPQNVATYSLHGTAYIRFWDMNSKKFLFELAHQGLIDYEFSSDGKLFASAGNETIYLWDISTQKISKELKSPGTISDIAFNPEGALIAAAANNGVYVWNTSSGKLASEFKEIRTATTVVFSPTENILCSVGYDSNVHPILFAWDLSDNKLSYKITSDAVTYYHPESMFHAKAGLLFSPDGSSIVTYGFSDYIQFWDALSGQLIKTLDAYKVTNELLDTQQVTNSLPYQNWLGFSLDGRLFALAGKDGIVRILNIPSQ